MTASQELLERASDYSHLEARDIGMRGNLL
jgi:hypothetical protein